MFEYVSDKSVKADNVLFLEHGKPLIFGKNRDKGIRLKGLEPEVVPLGDGITEEDLLVHDEKAQEPTLAYMLSRMFYPCFPECMGVFRDVQQPTYDETLNQKVEEARRAKGAGTLDNLFASDDVWVVEK